MSEFAPGNDYSKLIIGPGLQLPRKFTTEQWNQITASADPIVKGCILSCIYFLDKKADIIQQPDIHRCLPATVTRAVLKTLTGSDSRFLKWLESSNTDLRKILPVYPNWSMDSDMQFSLLMAAVKGDSWNLLIVFKNQQKRFVAPKIYSGKALLKTDLESVSDTHFMGLMLSLEFKQINGKTETLASLKILADPAIEELALQSVVRNELKVSQLLTFADLKFLKGTKPDIRQFPSVEPREAFFLIGDKSKKGLLISSYQQQAGVLGTLTCFGPFTAFDPEIFNQTFEMYISSHSLQPTKKTLLDYIDRCSPCMNIVSDNSQELHELGKRVLKQAYPTLQEPEGEEIFSVFTNNARLISAKQLDTDSEQGCWIAAIELTRSNAETDFNPLNDPIIMIFKVYENSENQGQETYTYRLQNMIIGTDCLQQELSLLSSERAQNSLLYQPIVEIIEKSKAYQLKSDKGISIDMVSYFIDTNDSEAVSLLIQHNMGYCCLKILIPEDGCLTFDSDNEHEKSIKIFLALKE